MSWKRIDSIAKRVIDRMNVTGEDVGASGPEQLEKVARPKPGQVQGGTVQQDASLPTHTKDASRYGRMDGFPQPGGRAPVHSMRQYLIVIEGGRQTHSNLIPNGPADHDALAGDDARHVLKLVV